MAMEPEIELFLEDLDRALGPVPLSDRIDLLSSTKKKALESSQLGIGASAQDVRNVLGDPVALADQFLRAGGFQGGAQRASGAARSVFKIFLATILLLFVLMAGGTAYLFWRFSPFVDIDQANQRIKLLGGYIDIDGKEGRLRVGENVINADEFDRTF